MRFLLLLRGVALVSLLMLTPLVAIGGYNTKSGGYNSDLYPPQGNLLQWLQFDDSTNMTVIVGTAATNSGYTVGQTNFQVALPKTTVTMSDISESGDYSYFGTSGGKPKYVADPLFAVLGYIEWKTASNAWFVGSTPSGEFLYFKNTNDTAFPPTSGWELGPDGLGTITVSYTSPWVDSGEFAALTESDLQTWNGTTNSPIKNIYTYSAEPSSYIDTVVTVSPYTGVYTNTTP